MGRYRTFAMAFLIAAAVGCSSLDESIRDAASVHRSVRKGMRRSEVYRLIGRPDREFPSGDASWITGRRCQRAELRLSFDENGRVSEIDRYVTR